MAERRRGAVLEQALLQAAWDELTDAGYARFTMDAVVQRAGTSPPVLYRRWANRDELARAAIANMLAKSEVDIPNTGSLRSDVLALQRSINAPNQVQLTLVLNAHLAAYYQATGTNPRDLLDQRRPDLDPLFDRAVDRGEASRERLTDRVKALPFDLLRHHILTNFEPAPDTTLEEIVDTIFLPLVR